MRRNPYEARSEEERLRNTARLGTRWQAREMTERERQWEQAMDVWRAREAYQAQTVLWVLVPLGVLVVLACIAGWLRG